MKSMPLPSTPRLCAQCGHELQPTDSIVTVTETRSSDHLLLHRACYETAFIIASSENNDDSDRA
jgi:hypothetical protein